MTGKLVNGKLIKGKHPSLITLETFLKVNNVIKHTPWSGIPKKHKQEQLPLKIFSKDEVSRTPFTGYITKGQWYYKNKSRENPVNINADHLDRKFVSFLGQFEYQKLFKDQLRKSIQDKLRIRLAFNADETTRLKKKLTERKNMFEKIQERYALGEIEKGLFEKFSKKYAKEIESIEQELKVQVFDSSNFEKIVEKGLRLAENISQL